MRATTISFLVFVAAAGLGLSACDSASNRFPQPTTTTSSTMMSITNADATTTTTVSASITTTTSITTTSINRSTPAGPCCLDGDPVCYFESRHDCLLHLDGRWEPGGATSCLPGLCVPRVSYAVPIEVGGPGLIGAIQFDIDYSAAVGEFAGEADAVECEAGTAIAGSIVSKNNESSTRTLRIGIISLVGVSAPARMFTCRFEQLLGDRVPVASDFAVTLIDLTALDFEKITPPLPVTVAAIEPVGGALDAPY